MDISHLLSSTIEASNTDTYFVQFPSFTGYVDTVLCNNGNTHIKVGTEEVSPVLETKGYIHDTHSLILASRFLSCVGVRIIDTDTIYEEKVFFIKGGELISFEILGKYYLALIYQKLDGDRDFYTNMPSTIPFRGGVEKSVFFIENTLFGTKVFLYDTSFVSSRETSKDTKEASNPSRKIYFLSDPLFPDSQETIRDFLLSQVPCKVLAPNISLLELKDLDGHDFFRIIGFLGTYTTILTEYINGLYKYRTMDKMKDGKFDMPIEFEESKDMNSLDPRWHEVRMSLLEIEYLLYSLEEHLSYLEKGIDAIDKLENVHILSQRNRLMMTEDSIRSILPKYHSLRNLLLERLNSKLHNQ